MSRPLSQIASGSDCRFYRENFSAGLEFYGGLGSSQQFRVKETAQYLAPSIVWNTTKNSALKVSPAFGLTHDSARMLIRFGYMYEINGFGSKVKHLFGAN